MRGWQRVCNLPGGFRISRHSEEQKLSNDSTRQRKNSRKRKIKDNEIGDNDTRKHHSSAHGALGMERAPESL
jgi:hypothetical protein